MIWLTWRQFRAQAAVTYGVIAAAAAVLVITASQLPTDTDGVGFLKQLTGAESAQYLIGTLAVLALPAVIGAFWGAPVIARELDAGTHRLIWNQGVTRMRWLAAKIGCTGLVAIIASGVASLAVTWWADPIDGAADSTTTLVGFYFPRLSPVIFDARGVAPLGYTAFAFVVGVTLGLLLGRTVSAMAATSAVFVAVRIVVSTWIRPSLATPVQMTTPITAANFQNLSGGRINVAGGQPAGAWIVSQHTVDAAGQPVSAPSWLNDCLGAGPGQQTAGCLDRLGRLGYQQIVTYQPGDRFWTFQFAELAVYLTLAVLLAVGCAWWLRRRVS
jgi:hypothetical protein